MNSFRLLRADEIECRISTVKQNGLSLLLYKDARCDMNILDESVGSMNWQKSYSRENANCTVSIWDAEKGQWISKEDTGTESFTEKEKGLASDSFKRACFNWGIGRELYTAPFIWIPAKRCNIQPKGNGFTCYDRFTVKRISYDEYQRIAELEITKDGQTVFASGSFPSEELATEKEKQRIWSMAVKKGMDKKEIIQMFRDHDTTYDGMTAEKYVELTKVLCDGN